MPIKYAILAGYVFRPEPEELLGFLVESIKFRDQWVQPPEIRNIDLYGKNSNPWTLFNGSSEQPCYVMTRLEKKVSGKSKFKRTAGTGTWKEQKSSDVAFRCQDGVKLKGVKRYFSFVPEKDSGYSREKHGQWIMNEYSLLHDGFEDYVICEIHKKVSSKRKLDDHGDDTIQNHVVMKKMRSTTTTLSSTTTLALVPVADSDHDLQGTIPMIQSVDPLEGHDHHYSSSSLSGDRDRDSIVKTDSCAPPLPHFSDDLWDFPAAFRRLTVRCTCKN